jgi:hypothetical protein
VAHTAPPTPSRRRIEFAFGVVLLLAGALVAILAVVALNSPQGQQAAGASETYPLNTPRVPASSTAAKPPASRSTSASPSPSATDSSSIDGAGSASGGGKLPLIVLNNTSDTPGSVAADRFQNAGWTVTDISTFTGAILSTAVYYDPDVAGAAAAAEELRQEFPAIHRVKQKFQGLPEGPLVVVLTSDYS